MPELARYEYGDNGLKYAIARLGAEPLVPILSNWTVSKDELIKKTAENLDASGKQIPIVTPLPTHSRFMPHLTAILLNSIDVFFHAVFYNVASQCPPHTPKLEFFYIHSTTLSVHFTDFLTNPWLSPEARVRLLEWKGRWDLANYASRGAAPLLAKEVTNYIPQTPVNGWVELIARANQYTHAEDGGHVVKMIRGVLNACKVCMKQDRDDFGLKRPDHWLKAGALIMDSVESGSPVWVRGGGFEQGWAAIPLRNGTLES